jgi:ubiquinone/menaquinone biosynthesis C-methylase UbiE
VSDPDTQRRESLERWDHVAAAWAKHADWVRDTTLELSRSLVEALSLQPGMTVLELAAGPGDTGFLAAELVQPGGKLISSDNSEAMIEIARERAQRQALEHVEFRVINAESIDLPVASVDAILCRWGLMLFIDPAAALGEMRRVLRPGGRAALAVWGPPERNQSFTVPAAVAIEHELVEAPVPGTPGPFALSDPERLRGLIEDAGFVEVAIDEVEMPASGTFEEWWERRVDMSMFGPALRAAPAEVQRAITAEVRRRISDLTGACWIAVAT